MKQTLIKQGKIIIEDVPVPKVEAGKVLVQVQYSCISAGTEMSGVKASGMPLWKRALQQPDKVKKVFDMALSQGFRNTAGVVSRKVASCAVRKFQIYAANLKSISFSSNHRLYSLFLFRDVIVAKATEPPL